MTTKYFDLVKPTYIESWPEDLAALSMAQSGIPLTQDEMDCLGHANGEYAGVYASVRGDLRDQDKHAVAYKQLADRVAAKVASYPAGAFVRLGSRSPKDSWTGHREGFKTLASDPLRLLTDSSERINDDLLMAHYNGYLPWIWVRQWLTINPWNEFRCFQHRGRLVGISQYGRKPHYPAIQTHAVSIEWAIRTFHSQKFAPVCHLRDVVFDLAVFMRIFKDENGIATTVSEVKLIEINPFFEMTDPILFTWKGWAGGEEPPADFDDTFRFAPKEKDS